MPFAPRLSVAAAEPCMCALQPAVGRDGQQAAAPPEEDAAVAARSRTTATVPLTRACGGLRPARHQEQPSGGPADPRLGKGQEALLKTHADWGGAWRTDLWDQGRGLDGTDRNRVSRALFLQPLRRGGLDVDLHPFSFLWRTPRRDRLRSGRGCHTYLSQPSPVSPNPGQEGTTTWEGE